MHDGVLVPSLRFPEFTGEWRVNSLGSLLTHSKSKNENSEFDKSQVLSVAAEAGVVNQIAYHGRSYAGVSVKPYNIIRKGEMVYTKSPLKAYPYGVMKLNEGEDGIVSTLYAVYKINKKASGRFLNYYFYDPLRINKYLKPLVNIGAKNDMKVNNNTVISGLITFPGVEEQQKIAAYLGEVDSKLTSIQAKVAAMHAHKKGVMRDLLSGKLRFKDENGSPYPDWETKKLGEIAKFSKGANISKDDVVESGKIPAVRYGELYTKYGEIINDVYSYVNLPAQSLVFSESNDVIIPASGETHIDIATASCVLKAGIALSGDINIIRSNINGVFLAHYLNNAKKHDIARLAQGVSVVHLYSSNLKDLQINLPSSKEQQKIANFLTTLDSKIKLEEAKLASTKEFKKALLQRMFA